MVKIISLLLSAALIFAPSVSIAACSWTDNSGTAASASTTDVQECLNDAKTKSGTVTVTIPSTGGTLTWTTGVTADMSTSGTWTDVTTLVFQGTSTTDTVLKDGTSSSLISFTVPSTKAVTIKNMHIKTKTGNNVSGSIAVSGGTTSMRITGNYFDLTGQTANRFILWGSYTDPDRTTGVIDSNTFAGTGTIGGNAISPLANRTTEWTYPLYLGTANAKYVEGNTITSAYMSDGFIDAYDGARYVVRFNDIANNTIGHHGRDSGTRGTLSYEIYNNNWTGSSAYANFDTRGGTGIVSNNTVSTSWASTVWIQPKPYRSCAEQANCGVESTVENADSSNTLVYDSTSTFAVSIASTTCHIFNSIPGYRPILYNMTDTSWCMVSSFETHTLSCDGNMGVATVNSSIISVTVYGGTSGATGYIVNSSSPDSNISPYIAMTGITGTWQLGEQVKRQSDDYVLTTSTTSVVGLHEGSDNLFESGDTYAVTQLYSAGLCLGIPPAASVIDGNTVGQQGYICQDQVGAAPNPDDDGATQIIVPSYHYRNTWKTRSYPTTTPIYNCDRARDYHVKANREYYDEVETFDGTTGVGSGTSRPSTCTPKVAYYNTSTHILSQCTATDTWTDHYEPYTCPHPLTDAYSNSKKCKAGTPGLSGYAVTPDTTEVETGYAVSLSGSYVPISGDYVSVSRLTTTTTISDPTLYY